jgi:hypothetical protein
MKKISCCCCWLLLSFSAVGCKQTSFEMEKKNDGGFYKRSFQTVSKTFLKRKTETNCRAEEGDLQGRRQKPTPAKNFRNSSSSSN